MLVFKNEEFKITFNNINNIEDAKIVEMIVKNFNKNELLEICHHLVTDGVEKADLVTAFKELNPLVDSAYRSVIDDVIAILNSSIVGIEPDSITN